MSSAISLLAEIASRLFWARHLFTWEWNLDLGFTKKSAFGILTVHGSAFASTTTTYAEGVERLKQYKKEIEDEGGFGSFEECVGKPSLVDAPPKVRTLANEKGTLVHFPIVIAYP